MIVDAELNSVLLEFIEINKYNRKGPCFYSASQLDDIFDRSVENITRFYTEFVNTTEGFEQEINPDSVKVYLRLFPTTGNWYIGYTMKKFADQRHSADISSSKTLKDTNSSPILEFYRQYPDIPAMIFTIAQVNDVKSALIIESRLLRHFTNPSNNTPLPINLCLNSEGIYRPPIPEINRPSRPRSSRPTPKIVEIDELLGERGRMIKEMLLQYTRRIDKSSFDVPLTSSCT
jgi:hypothetical protein